MSASSIRRRGARLPESLAYMAEIIDRFDLVALQEVWDDLRALDRLRDRLGHQVSDVTKATPVTGNVGLPLRHTQGPVLGNGGGTRAPTGRKGRQDGAATQVTRTPLMAAFQVGWTKFVLATVHIIYGDKTAEPVARVEEIRQIARFLGHRTDIKTEPIRNIIILGDFNIFSDSDATLREIGPLLLR